MSDNIKKAIEIFRTLEVKGKFKAYQSESNQNEVDIMDENGLYCTINVSSGRIKGL